MTDIDDWIICMIVYFVLAAVTFLPVLRERLRRVRIEKNPFSGVKFENEDSEHKGFKEGQWKRLEQHFDRMSETLGRWEKNAGWNKNFHFYVLCWTLPISIVIPVMVAFIDLNEYYAKVFLMIISLHSALMLGFHRALKVENNFKSFRQGRADFGDLCRRFLDMPQTFGGEDASGEDLICNYFAESEAIRKFVRAAETDNFPGLEDKTGAAARDRMSRRGKGKGKDKERYDVNGTGTDKT
jgi:hypothetical protein